MLGRTGRHQYYHFGGRWLRFVFPDYIGDAKLAMSDRMAEGIDPLKLNNTKLPFLLAIRQLKVTIDPSIHCLIHLLACCRTGCRGARRKAAVPVVVFGFSPIHSKPIAGWRID